MSHKRHGAIYGRAGHKSHRVVYGLERGGGGSEMGFKIKRPDYGSGQLERDLIFYGLKIVTSYGMKNRARAMPLGKAKIRRIMRVARGESTTLLVGLRMSLQLIDIQVVAVTSCVGGANVT